MTLAIIVFISVLILNIPIYAFFAWIMFDNLRNAKESIFVGLIKTMSMLISFRLFAYLLSDEDDDNSMFNIIVVLAASAMLIFFECWGIVTLWPSLLKGI